MSGRLYCTPRAMWKLSWFLRDFGYDSESLGKNAIDDKALIDLRGVVKSPCTASRFQNFDRFAPSAESFLSCWPKSRLFPLMDSSFRGLPSQLTDCQEDGSAGLLFPRSKAER
jgi:hypothetical protein